MTDYPPTAGLLISIALRFDHGFGIWLGVGFEFLDNDLPSKQLRLLNHAANNYRNRDTLKDRQVLAEIRGVGFYNPKEEEYYFRCCANLAVVVEAKRIADELIGENMTMTAPMPTARIENDVKEAMKAKDAVRLTVLRGLLNRIKMIAKNDGNRDVTEDDVLSGIQKAIKEVNETRDIYLGRGVDTSEQDAEIAILTGYLPAQMSETDLEATITTIITGLGDSAPKGKALLGPIMKTLKEKHAGQYNPQLASKIAGRIVG